MTRLLLLLVVFLALSACPSYGDPTYTECKPHIDATIMDLAAKAVQSGEEPNKPGCVEVPSIKDAKPDIKEKEQEKNPVKPRPTPEKENPVKEPPSLTSEKSNEKKQKVPTEKAHPIPEKEKSSPRHEEESPKEFKPPVVEEKVEKKVSKPTKSDPPSQDKQRKPKLTGFDAFMATFFGYRENTRDPKWAKPWNTHSEFTKRFSAPKEKKVDKKIDKTPGYIGSFLNKMVSSIFTITKGERDPKWAEPWQKHKEHAKQPKSSLPKKVEKKKSMLSIGFINSFIQTIFGNDSEGSRDAKWAKPWNTHAEHKRTPKQEKSSAPKSKPIVKSKGGLINSMITCFFEVPRGGRDEKWAKPWQTHQEHKKKIGQKQAPTASKKISTESGAIGQFFNRLVLMVFKHEKIPRAEKWAKPWQTHKEHVRGKRAPTKKIETKKQTRSNFLGIPNFLNSVVESIFGKTSTDRDAKWAQPWNTHKGTKPLKSRLTGESPSTKPSAHVETPKPAESNPKPKPSGPASDHSAPADSSAPKHSSTSSPSPQPAVKEEKEKTKEAPKKKPETDTQTEAFPSDTKDGGRSERTADRERVVVSSASEDEQGVDESSKKKKKERVVETVVEDEEQIVLIPSAFRPRDHIDSILGLDKAASMSSARTEPIAEATLRELKKIYNTGIKPLETIYKYQDISNRHLSDAEIFGTPLVLMVGPYSTGKSTFINYLLGTEFTKRALKTGAPPSHGVFRLIKYGDKDRQRDGTDLSGHWSFGSLQKFGQNFVDQLQGVELNIPLLKKITLVEAPGILEMRRPAERLYPFNDVVQWFMDRADLILVMFDYTKLDAGYELEAILDQLKGREAQTRILLNKADQVPPEELIKVQGSLFWNLSPLLGMSAPPTVYAGSFTSLPYRPSSPVKLFQAQEEALLHDMAKAINSKVENRIAIARRHAVRVRNHAQMVDTYLKTYYQNKGFLSSKHKLAEEITENPHAYNIYEGISLLKNISRYDLPDAEVYRDFFRIHNLYDFRSLRETCTYLTGCPLDKLDAAISKQLPELVSRYRRQVDAANPDASLPRADMRTGGFGAGAAHTQHSKA